MHTSISSALRIATTILALVVLLLPTPAGADPLRDAEAAYQNVDFEATLEHAQAALEAGGNTLERTGRIYFLIGLSKSALGDHDGAREAFKRMLVVQPDVQIEKTLSPQLRGPYLEARGYWNSTTARAGIKARMLRDEDELAFAISDPVGFVEQVRVRTRTSLDADYDESTVAVEEGSAKIEVPGLERYVEFSAALLDVHGNVVFQQGTDEDPETLGRLPAPSTKTVAPEVDSTTSAPPEGRSRSGKTQRVLGGIVMGLGVVSAGVGVPFHLRREDHAAEWNSDACEQPTGQSRSEQCTAVERERRSAETAAAILYGVGGGLMVLGAVTLLTAPKGRERPPNSARITLGGGPGRIGVACSGRF